MRIVCPGCAAEYEVPLANLHPQRKVRCARCDTLWVPESSTAADQPIEPPRPAPPVAPVDPVEHNAGIMAMDRLAGRPPPPPPPPSGMLLRAAWVITLLVLVGSAAAVLTWRAQVTRVWPASTWLLGGSDRVAAAPAKPPQTATKPDKSPD